MITSLFILPWLIFPTLLYYYVITQFKSSPYLKIYFFYIFYQVLLSILLIFISIYRWEYGDLYAYYDLPIQIIENGCIFDLSCEYPFSNTHLISYIHSFILYIFPRSLIGLGVLGGTIAALAYILLIENLREIICLNNFIITILLFLPILHLMSSFTGKDSYSFLLTVICLISTCNIIAQKNINKNLCTLILSLTVLYLIRPHLSLIYLFPIVTYLIYKKLKIYRKFYIYFVLFLTLFIIVLFFLVNHLFPQFYFLDFKRYMSVAYSGGNLVLEPFTFPLSFFQLFRPFPWEVNSFIYFYISIENLLVLIFFFYNFLSFFKTQSYKFSSLSDIYKFTLFYFLCIIFSYLTIYGFSQNVGDLIRRHLYFYPFLLLCFLPPAQKID